MPPVPPEYELSIVVPALDEEDSVGPLVREVELGVRGAGVEAELIVVDDGSTDRTLERLRALVVEGDGRRWLRVLHRDRPQGQSAAMHAGILAARGRYIATLDADLQNDPAELPAMLRLLQREGAGMVQGDRSAARRDNAVRRAGSVVGRKARNWLLRDPTRDTGCSARVMRADLAKAIPLQFKGMHRFFPAYIRLSGGRVIELPVQHRPRAAGQTKYGLGVFNRGFAGMLDLLAVRWMSRRIRDAAADEELGSRQ